MKTDKEYPATHSMETAWFAVDADGYVAIMQCDQHGPAPVGAPDIAFSDEALGIALGMDWEDPDDSIVYKFDFTEDQIDSMMRNAITGREYYEVYKKKNHMLDVIDDAIVEIDKTREDEFLEILKMHPENQARCLSCEKRIYAISLQSNCVHMKAQPEEEISDPLWLAYIHLCKDEIIKRIANYSEISFNDVPKIKHAGSDTGLFVRKGDVPFYLYNHPDCGDDLFTRENHPERPIHISQLVESNIKDIPRVNIRFKETLKFQVAEFVACEVCQHVAEIDGEEYFLARCTDGKYYYVPYRRKGKPIPATDDDVNEYYK